MDAYCMIARALLKLDLFFCNSFLACYSFVVKIKQSRAVPYHTAKTHLYIVCEGVVQFDCPQLASKYHIYQNHYYIKGTICCPSFGYYYYYFFFFFHKDDVVGRATLFLSGGGGG